MKRGVSLIELLIAMVILALGLLPVGLLFSTTGKETEHDRMELEATALASETLEQVRSMAEGRIGVTGMKQVPERITWPQLAEWADIEALLQAKGVGFPLYDGCPGIDESSRMYIEPTRPGYRRWLQVFQARLLEDESSGSSSNLLDIRVKVEYGIDGAKRSVTLDTLVSNEDVTAR